MRFGFGGALAALAMLSAPAAAKDDPAPSPLIVELEKCLAITTDAARLACTDIAARRLVDASRRKDVMVVDREEMKKTRKSLFGFTLPRIGLFGRDGPDEAEEVARVDLKISRATPLGYGKYTFTMEDGARWSTTEAWVSAPQPKAGDVLTIKRAAMGSYMVSLKGGRSVRAMRVG